MAKFDRIYGKSIPIETVIDKKKKKTLQTNQQN